MAVITPTPAGAFIPMAGGNRDYQEYQEWLADGGVPEPAQSLEEIRQEVAGKIHEEKRTAKSKGVLIDGVLFETDENARLAYLEFMIKLLQDPNYSVADWKASPGVWVTLDGPLFTKLITAWELRLTSLFSFVKSKEQEVSTATDPTQINLEYTGA